MSEPDYKKALLQVLEGAYDIWISIKKEKADLMIDHSYSLAELPELEQAMVQLKREGLLQNSAGWCLIWDDDANPQ